MESQSAVITAQTHPFAHIYLPSQFSSTSVRASNCCLNFIIVINARGVNKWATEQIPLHQYVINSAF
jgi:hypothetical protein